MLSEPTDAITIREGRVTTVAGSRVIRVLPTRGRRTVGPWCFVDCMTPNDFDNPAPLEVGPHPHTGLATVTWLMQGEALHGDSLGTEQLIRPGQLNLMTAGRGIAHAELGVTGPAFGVQMWLAQPDAHRNGESRFEHHADLPQLTVGSAEITVLLGSLGEERSAARFDHPLVGLDLRMRPGTVEIPTEQDFEYGIVPMDQSIKIVDAVVEPGWLGLVSPGFDSITIEAGSAGARVMVVGGLPLGERIQMWWNFVARTKDELTEAWRDWQTGNTDRFGPVPSKLARIDAPRPTWLRSTER